MRKRCMLCSVTGGLLPWGGGSRTPMDVRARNSGPFGSEPAATDCLWQGTCRAQLGASDI